MPLHHRAITLGDRDLFGDIVRSARADGLKVIARMDSYRVAEDFYRAHPDWICVNAEGTPFRQADKYVTCINSPYYSEYLPGIMEEVIGRYQPDGFSDNSWPGMSRERIRHCGNCAQRFLDRSGLALPRAADWSNEAYRLWIRWNYERRVEQWDLHNTVTTRAGGKDCLWSGMISGDVLANGNRFVDLRAILSRTEIVMLDHQRRNGIDGFEQNTEAGKRLHELAGWHKHIPESMPQYQLGAPAFRVASMPPPRRGCGPLPPSPAASCRGGTISARCTRTGASIRPRSRSSPGTQRTRTCCSIASHRPMWASCGGRAITISMARTRPMTGR